MLNPSADDRTGELKMKFRIKTVTVFPLQWDELEASSLDEAKQKAIEYADQQVDAKVSTVRTKVEEIEEVQ